MQMKIYNMTKWCLYHISPRWIFIPRASQYYLCRRNLSTILRAIMQLRL